jgi:hypothetical protein
MSIMDFQVQTIGDGQCNWAFFTAPRPCVDIAHNVFFFK